MEIDAYQLCPCQSGNKIKFCCGKNIVGDLNKILSKSSSGQTQAALDLLDRVAAKSGDKDCLLVIKTHILLSIDEVEQAKSVNKTFRTNSPDHPMGKQHLALLDLAEGNLVAAVNSLQDAMDAQKGAEIPVAVGNTFKIVANSLVDNNHLYAGLAHLNFAGLLYGEQNQDIAEFYAAVHNELSFLPFLFQPQALLPAPEDCEWEKLYLNAGRAISRGQFRRALQYLTKIDTDFDQHPTVVKGLAMTKTMLAHDDAAEAWRRYAAIDGVNCTLAAEALAFAYETDDSWVVPDPILIYRYELDDIQAVSEKLSDSKLFEPVEIPGSLPDGTPPPRFGFAVMDKPVAEKTTGLTVDDVAQRVANVEIYGKQTDRAARLDLWVTSSRVDKILQILADAGAELPNPSIETSENETSTQQDSLLSTQALLPLELEIFEHDRLIREHRLHSLVEKVPDLQLDIHHEQTIAEASQDPKLRNLVYARLLILVSNSKSRYAMEGTFDKMLDHLGLPPMDSVSPDEPTALVSPLVCRSVDSTQLSLQQLLALEAGGVAVNDCNMVRKSLREQLTREDRDQSMDCRKLMMLNKCNLEVSESLEVLQQSQQIAQQYDDELILGLALCEEFEIRLFLREVPRAREIVAEISKLSKIEAVQYEFTQILAKHGLLNDAMPLEQQLANQSQALATNPVETAAEESRPKLILPD